MKSKEVMKKSGGRKRGSRSRVSNMAPLLFHIPRFLKDILNFMAEREGVTMGKVIRDAILFYFMEKYPELAERVVIRLGSEDSEDVSDLLLFNERLASHEVI